MDTNLFTTADRELENIFKHKLNAGSGNPQWMLQLTFANQI